MKYLRRNFAYWFTIIIIFLFYNFYFIYLLTDINIEYLLYLDVLVLSMIASLFFITYYKYKKKETHKKECLESTDIIAPDLIEFENIDIALHDNDVYQKYLQQQYDINQDLQDYIARWCHEVKLPLSAAMLMNERIGNEELKEQLEKINAQLNMALLGCKVQSQLYDIQIKKIDLLECVRTSIKNNRYFLIKNKFNITIDIVDGYVYSDKEWIVYILDQIIGNAIKYSTKQPTINIWSQKINNTVYLYIKDLGDGINDHDLPRIFERGFTGNNYHNGQYKSTGMGLYMVKLIADKLGHSISVESEINQYTQFCIMFSDNETHFMCSCC